MEKLNCVPVNEGRFVKVPKDRNLVKCSKYKKKGVVQTSMAPKGLFQDIQDQSFCGYPAPGFGYSFEQVAVPIYPLIPAAPLTTHCPPTVLPSCRQRKQRLGTGLINKNTEQYTSLPPGLGADFGTDHRRRFSDPGLLNQLHSDDCSSNSSATDDELVILEDIQRENERLTIELSSTKEEVRSLRNDVNYLMETQLYPPGAIAGMVKEIEDAIEVKEQAFLAKTKRMVKDAIFKMEDSVKSINNEEKRPSRQEYEEIKKKLNDALKDRDMMNQKLLKLEEFVHCDIIHRLLKLEELMTSHLGDCVLRSPGVRNVAGSNFYENKLCKQFQDTLGSQREMEKGSCPFRMKPFSSKMSNISNEDKEKNGTGIILSSLETSESLASSVGSGSLHSPLVTMSGPVTDV